MANVGDRFKTGQTCSTKGSYAYDGYTDGTTAPPPTQNERVIPLQLNEAFPPVRSSNKGAWWKLQRVG